MRKIFIPATSANVGAGFDCLGLALDLYNVIEYEVLKEKKLIIELADNDKGRISRGSNNLIYKTITTTLKILGKKTPGLYIKETNNIPLARGLGSSSACIVGGIAIANDIAGSPLTKKEMLAIATEMEKHPDNVAPAIFGGFVVSVIENGKVECIKVTPPPFKYAVFIPNFALKTSKARAVLPTELSYKDAVYNISRAALTATALATGNIEILKTSINDKMHQPYRKKLIPNYDNIINIANKSGAIAAYLSGAGPTIMALVEEDNDEFYDNATEKLGNLNSVWEVKMLNTDKNGLIIE